MVKSRQYLPAPYRLSISTESGQHNTLFLWFLFTSCNVNEHITYQTTNGNYIHPNMKYYNLLEQNGDPRTESWFLISSPTPTIILSLAYVAIVVKLGPDYMKNRKPYELRNTLILYNAFQVALSACLFYGFSDWLTEYSWLGQSVDYSMNPKAIQLAGVLYWYYISKFTEFFDTFFFVLRKKLNNISFLHVFHHGVTPFLSWCAVKFCAGGSATFVTFLNSFVHIIMYTYYMFAAMGPQYQKYLWWKKYLTIIQLIQFALIFFHFVNVMSSGIYNIPRGISYAIIAFSVSLSILFLDFYRSEYKRKIKKDDAESTKSNTKNPINLCFSNQDALFK